jgi:hypothetical protein
MKTNFESLVEEILNSDGLVSVNETRTGIPGYNDTEGVRDVGSKLARSRDRNDGSSNVLQFKLRLANGKVLSKIFDNQKQARAYKAAMGERGNGAVVIEA